MSSKSAIARNSPGLSFRERTKVLARGGEMVA
jgi:hypothetical protein